MQQRFLVCAALVIASILSVVAVSDAGDRGRNTHKPPDIQAWIERLTDRAGVNCCSTADGIRPKAVDWDIGANHYRVKVDGKWMTVPDRAAIRGPNRLGHAVVWLYYDMDYVSDAYVRCFLPGPAG